MASLMTPLVNVKDNKDCARMINQLNLPRGHPGQILIIILLIRKFWSVSGDGLVTFTEEALNGKLHFLCSGN